MSFEASSILKTPLEIEILKLCEQNLTPMGFRAVDVDCRVGGRSLVRIFIERVNPEGTSTTVNASLEDCATVSRAVSPLLEASEHFPGPYDLEVSTPGLDRRLRLESDFERVVGKEVKLKLVESIVGRGANLTGTLEKVTSGNLVLRIQKDEVSIPLPKVKQANAIWHMNGPAN